MNKNTYLFDGEMRTLSPFSTCSPALADESKKSKGSNKKSPLKVPTITSTQGVRMYIPGQGIRSKLRGALTHIAGEYSLNFGKKKLSLFDSQYLRLGGVKQGGAEVAVRPDEMAKVLEENPLISLFGASTPWVKGKLMVGHAIDTGMVDRNLYHQMLADGVRAEPIQRDPGLMKYLDDAAMNELAANAAKVKKYSGIKKEILALEREIFLIKGDAAAKDKLKQKHAAMVKDSKDHSIVSTQMPLDGYEAIPPYSILSHSMRLLQGTTMELGALLDAIDGFTHGPLGAHANHGNGEVLASWKVRCNGKVLGTVIAQTFEGIRIEDDENGTLTSALNSFREAINREGFYFYAREEIMGEIKDGDDNDK
jgi:hypothetical protein